MAEYQMTTAIAVFVDRIFRNKLTIDRVPERLREAVQSETTENRSHYVDLWAAKLLDSAYNIDSVPESLREDVQNQSEVLRKLTEKRIEVYVYDVIDGLSLSEVPEEIREKVREKVEQQIGKKLD